MAREKGSENAGELLLRAAETIIYPPRKPWKKHRNAQELYKVVDKKITIQKKNTVSLYKIENLMMKAKPIRSTAASGLTAADNKLTPQGSHEKVQE